jgi:hypothetical protein
MAPLTNRGTDRRAHGYNPAMPSSTLIIVVGSWVVLAVLTVVAYRFNRSQRR